MNIRVPSTDRIGTFRTMEALPGLDPELKGKHDLVSLW